MTTWAERSRATARGDLAIGADPMHLAELVAAPLFFRFLMTRQPIDTDFVERHLATVIRLAT